MCGFAGFVNKRSAKSTEALENLVLRMSSQLRHRGPDDSGYWVDTECSFAMGFRRLSILDLSAAGHQPMVSANGRWVITFNGEIYNFSDLRSELEAVGVRFASNSDTEVVVESFSKWGVTSSIKKLDGMFAIAAWDRRDRKLYLIRDRLGVKPLYWAKFQELFLFGSELKSLRVHDGWTPQVDPNAVAAFFRHTYVPAPYTIYRNVFKLMPGCFLVFDVERNELHTEAYWQLSEKAAFGLTNQLNISEEEAVDRFEELLTRAVRRRMVADVPVGVFLSGGFDSSIVAAIMQAADIKKAKTFSIGFSEKGYNEAVHAKRYCGVFRH